MIFWMEYWRATGAELSSYFRRIVAGAMNRTF